MGNPFGLYGIDEYILQYEQELDPPWKNPDLYVKLGYPFLHADRIKTPTLFMGGDADFNVPITGGEQMYQALRSLNVPTELVIYPESFTSSAGQASFETAISAISTGTASTSCRKPAK